MYKKSIYYVSFIFLLVLSTASYGVVVIGNWEDDSLDGWEICTFSPEGNTVLTPGDTNGVTLDSGSLKMVNDLGEYKFALIFNLQNNDLADDFFANHTFMLDVTRLASEWTISGSNYNGLKLIVNSDAGWDDLGNDIGSYWSPSEGDVTLTASWDYSAIKAELDPETTTYVEFIIVTTNNGYSDGGIYYLDNARLFGSVFAHDPDPEDEETEVPTEPTLRWTMGDPADTHDVYFGTDEDVVTDASRSSDPCDVLVKQDHNTNSINIADEVGTLEFGETYYWRIDEVNENAWAPAGSPWKGDVWSFTTGHYLTVEDYEDYASTNDLKDVWHVSGSDISIENTIVNNGLSSMQYDYTNDIEPYYTEAYANTSGLNSLGFGTDWTKQDVKVLSLYFKGYLPAGSFTVNPGPPVTYTIESDGWDIYDVADGFRYAYKVINTNNPPGSITAKVESIENTDAWAKAGVMMRYTLDAGSQTAYVVMTPGNGVSFQWRDVANGTTEYTNVTGVTAPQWVRLSYGSFTVDEVFYNYKGEYADGSIAEPDEEDWQLIDYANITTGLDWYIGLCVSSHTEAALCTAEFSDVNMTGTISGDWTSQDIGIQSNEGEPMYVVLQDSDSNAIVYHDDSNATQIATWTEWRILLDEFVDVNLKDVQKIYIGIGDPCSGGTGTVYFDDIRLRAPECILSERSPDFAKADYAPASYPESGDCVIDYREIEIMGRDWLVYDEVITTTNPGTDNLVAYYPLDSNTGTTAIDAVGDHNGTLSDEGVTWLSPGLMGTSAVSVDGGEGSRISIGDWDPVGPNGLTLSAWVKWGGTTGNPGDQSQGIICKRDGWSEPNQLQFMFEVDTPGSNGAIQFRQHDTAGTDVSTAPGAMIPFIGRWAHVGATYNGTIATIYINGRAVGSGPFSMAIGTDTGMVIGNINSDSWPNCPGTFYGDIDEVKIYNRAMMSEEVAYLADLTPEDNEHQVPVPSPAELYEGESKGSRSVNFRDFASLALMWLEEDLSLKM